MKLTRRIKSRAGFTLAETLLALLILLLVSSIVATGIPAAKSAYEKVILGSNAQVLLSTTASALRSELGTAWGVETSGTTVTYFSADTGAKSKINVKGNVITCQHYAGAAEVDTNVATAAEHLLVSNAAVTSQLYVKYDSVSYDAAQGVVSFGGLRVYSTKDKKLADLGNSGSTLVVRVFSAN